MSIKYTFDISTKNNNLAKILGNQPENTNTTNIDISKLIKSYYLKSGFLKTGEEKEFSLNLWLDENTPISEMNKTFQSKIYITSVATDEAPLAATLKISKANVSNTDLFLEGPLERGKIESIEFTTSNKVPDNVLGSWDVSKEQNSGIMAWYRDEDTNGLYELFIGQQEMVIANDSSAYLFSSMTNLKSIDLQNFDTSDTTNMSYMFQNCNVLEKLNLDSFDTFKVTNMSYMFHNCKSLLTLNNNNFNTSNVINMSDMFHGCEKLSEINTKHFNTEKVTDISSMFRDCNNVEELNLSNFNTKNVRYMGSMFYTSYGKNALLKNVDVSSFDTSNVTSMYNLFYNKKNLEELDLSNFNTAKVTSFEGLFYNNRKLTSLDLSNFDSSSVTDYGGGSRASTFEECVSLVELNISNMNFDKAVTYDKRLFINVPLSTNVYVKDNDAKVFIEVFYKGTIIDCSANSCP